MRRPRRLRLGRSAAAPAVAAAIALGVIALTSTADRQEKFPNDPYLYSKGSWGQSYADQWGHWKVGLTPKGQNSAWDIEDGDKNPVIVAFVDTGLDYVHPKIAKRNVW